MRRRAPLRTSENARGAVAVEFAAVSLVLLLLLFGVIEFGFLWMQSHYINNAAREGARAAAKLNLGDDPVPVVETAVKEMLKGVYADARVDDPANCCASGRFIAVTVDDTATLEVDGTPLRAIRVEVDVRTAEVWQPVLWSLLNLLPGVALEDLERVRGNAVFVRQDQSTP